MSISGSAGVVPVESAVVVVPNGANVTEWCQDARALPSGAADAARGFPGSVDGINGGLGVLTPTNRGVKYPRVDTDAIKSGSIWTSPLGSPRSFSAACDWLTLTATNDAGIRQLFALMLVLSDDLRASGDDTKEGKELQYQGHRVGRHLFYGESDRQGGYLRVSGSVAPAALEHVRQVREHHFRATRNDVQLTAVYPASPSRDFFRSMAEQSQDFGANSGRRGRPWVCELRDTIGRGDTAYIGDKATAEVYGRSYDKHKEGLKQGIDYPAGTVRFEVSHRREKANMLLAAMCATDDVQEYASGYVAGWFVGRGIEISTDGARVDQLPGISHQSDTEKRRRWLRTQVRPSVELQVNGIGLEETLKDLGLWEQVCKQYIEVR